MSTDPRAAYEAVADELTGTSPAIRGQMFGMPCLKIEGKTFAGFHQGAMVFKLGAPAHGEASWRDVPTSGASRRGGCPQRLRFAFSHAEGGICHSEFRRQHTTRVGRPRRTLDSS